MRVQYRYLVARCEEPIIMSKPESRIKAQAEAVQTAPANTSGSKEFSFDVEADDQDFDVPHLPTD